MKQEQAVKPKWGIFAGAAAYFSWGVLPFYWKALAHIPPLTVLSYRMIWSCAFMVVVLLVSRQMSAFLVETRAIFANKKRLAAIIAAAVLVTTNWFVFIFSVSSGKVIDASLGYYMNPLVNVLLATLFLKERLGRAEAFACLVASVGVILLAIQSGAVPWASLTMALTFSLYGFIKKQAQVSSLTGLTLETALITPFALIYLLAFSELGLMSFGLSSNLLLIGAGVVTAIPLFLFAEATKNISFILVGFLQYLAPTLMLLGAIFQFHETFNATQMFAFSWIWLGIAIFTWSNIVTWRKFKRLGATK